MTSSTSWRHHEHDLSAQYFLFLVRKQQSNQPSFDICKIFCYRSLLPLLIPLPLWEWQKCFLETGGEDEQELQYQKLEDRIPAIKDIFGKNKDDNEKDGSSNESEDEEEDLDPTRHEQARGASEQEEWPDWENWDGKEKYDKWPQENQAYFKRAKKKFGIHYVRTDLYPLSTVCALFRVGGDMEGEFPSMESAYGGKEMD